MAITNDAQLGQLLIAVALLEDAKILEVSEATEARQRISELSKRVMKRSQKTLAGPRRKHERQTFLETLAEDAPILTVLQRETLGRLNNKKAKLLMFLFNNRERVVTRKELYIEGWNGENAENSLNARITEIRNVIEPYIVIDCIRNDGFQLRVVSNEPAREPQP